jgi:hypothetical protein
MWTWENFQEWFVSGLFQNFIWVVVGIVFVNLIQKPIDYVRYGNWQVLITKNKKTLLQKPVSAAKVKHIQTMPEDKLVFLKGLVAPFEMLNCDLLQDGPNIGLYHEDAQARKFIINLDKNPKLSKNPKQAKL